MDRDGQAALSRAGALRAGVVLSALGLCSGAAQAESVYTTFELSTCDILQDHSESDSLVARCAGHDGIDIVVQIGDLRADVDYGVRNENFETFGTFNTAGDTVEWVSDGRSVVAGILRFALADPESGEDIEDALVVSSIGTDSAPGCVVGVVSAREEQANGVARGMAAMAPLFDCSADVAAIFAPADSLARSFLSAQY